LKKKSLANWIKLFKQGKFNSRDVRTQIEAGWYDWFCKDTALANKTKRLGRKVIRLAKTEKIKPLINKIYVWFKNNCPLSYGLYDDFRFARLSDGGVLYTVTPRDPHNNNKPSVYSREHKGEFVFEKWSDLVKWFDNKKVRFKFVKYEF
jgi:hypothetical protein